MLLFLINHCVSIQPNGGITYGMEHNYVKELEPGDIMDWLTLRTYDSVVYTYKFG